MGLVSRFEDLEAWREARSLTLQVYTLASASGLRRDFALADQLKRAAISTMNNIAEGFDSASRPEFRRFLRYAARSASEVQSCLYIARDQRYIDKRTFDHCYVQAESVCRLCAALGRRLAAYSRTLPDGGGRVADGEPAYLAPCSGHRRTGAPAYRPTTAHLD